MQVIYKNPNLDEMEELISAAFSVMDIAEKLGKMALYAGSVIHNLQPTGRSGFFEYEAAVLPIKINIFNRN